MKFTRSLIFLVVTGVIALHSLIPHDHHQSAPYEFSTHDNSNSLIDQIALGFHLSQIDGELEDMVFCASVTIDHSTLAVLDLFSDKLNLNLSVDESSTIQSNTWVEPVSELHSTSLSQRGPPQV